MMADEVDVPAMNVRLSRFDDVPSQSHKVRKAVLAQRLVDLDFRLLKAAKLSSELVVELPDLFAFGHLANLGFGIGVFEIDV
jgi:hypothetical protein